VRTLASNYTIQSYYLTYTIPFQVFSIPMSYYKHIKVHSSVKPFFCSVCGYRAVRRDNVQQHVRKVHKLEDAVDYVKKDGSYEYENESILSTKQSRAKKSRAKQSRSAAAVSAAALAAAVASVAAVQQVQQ
jgi:hypothetical protein